MLLGMFFLICVLVRRPPIGGSATSKVMSGVFSQFTTARAVVSAVSLYVIFVCDTTFRM
jgi:hypothetical protein